MKPMKVLIQTMMKTKCITYLPIIKYKKSNELQKQTENLCFQKIRLEKFRSYNC
ncbi:MAG: hypothetical protein KatS3mg028_0355 [Bacteroidia bacterium]|nr:MAG: hypothetical protein KatS3mg028_0355 [Bacteroidia bacterium]